MPIPFILWTLALPAGHRVAVIVNSSGPGGGAYPKLRQMPRAPVNCGGGRSRWVLQTERSRLSAASRRLIYGRLHYDECVSAGRGGVMPPKINTAYRNSDCHHRCEQPQYACSVRCVHKRPLHCKPLTSRDSFFCASPSLRYTPVDTRSYRASLSDVIPLHAYCIRP